PCSTPPIIRSTWTSSEVFPIWTSMSCRLPRWRGMFAAAGSTAPTTGRGTSTSAASATSCPGSAICCGAGGTSAGPCSTRSGEPRLVARPRVCHASAPMRLAASLPVPPDLAMCRRVAERVESLGYDSVWIADTGAGPDAFVVGAAVGTCTEKLRIGTAVVPVYTRTPSVMAACAGSLAQLAPGRIVLGIGASSETIVDAWGGVPYERPLARMRESVTLLRQMLAGERVTFAGQTLRTKGFRLVSPPPLPVPIYLAALMPPMLELAG